MGFLGVFQKRDTSPPMDDVLLDCLIRGENISKAHALTVPAVSSAVDFISGTIAAMPVRLYQNKDGKISEQVSDIRQRLLNLDTGDTLDAFQMKKAIIRDYLIGKGGYAYIDKIGNAVKALKYVDEEKVTKIEYETDPLSKVLRVGVNGREFLPWQFVKVLRQTKNGITGKSLLDEVAKAIETAYKSLMLQLRLTTTGGSKRGFLKSEHRLGPEEIRELKAAWERMYAEDSVSAVVLNNGLDFKEASSSAVELQLVEARRALTEDIRSIFHISDDMERTFKECIFPIIKAFETALNSTLLLEREKSTMYFAFDPKEILRMNMKERFEAYRIAEETGFYTINEIRAEENLERVEGLDVVNVGLGAVLYNTQDQTYYTPNTDTTKGGRDDNSTNTKTDER